MSETYSHSRLSSFETCPRKFQYRYLWKLPAESESIEAFVGKRVHEVLERLHRVVDRGRLPSLPRVIERYHQLFDDAYDSRVVRIVREGMTTDFYREVGENCLANYYHDHYPFDGDETLALEEHVRFSLDREGRYRMQGFVDRIARAKDGAIEIQDYKTSARVPSRTQIAEDRQLALYQIAIQQGKLGARFGADRPVRLVWHFLRQGKTLVSTRAPVQLARLAEQTQRLIDRIRGATDFPARPGPLCGWCEYRRGCDASAAFAGAPHAQPLAEMPAGAVARATKPPRSRRPAADRDQLAFRFGS